MAFVAFNRSGGRPADLEPADAVLVLGTSATVGGRPNPCMTVRVAAGVDLVQEGLAPVLVVSGGLDSRDGIVEAARMAQIAVKLGLDPDQVLEETQARSTIDNITFGHRVLEHHGRSTRLILVTEPFHLPRALYAAERLGVDAQGVASDRCPERSPLWLIREPVAVVWYWLRLGMAR